jgi:beta-lactamase regulating signal transducer with metallopeptidase domain
MVTLSPLPDDAAAWLMFLGEVSIRATLLLAVAAAVCVVLRRASAALRHLVWVLAMLCVLCLPAVSTLRFSWRIPGLRWMERAETRHRVSAVRLDSGQRVLETTSGVVAAAPAGMARTTTDRRSRAAAPRVAALRRRSWSTAALVLAAWGSGAAALLLYAVAGVLCLLPLRRNARRVQDPSWQALLDEASAQLRLRRPVVLLQSQLSGVPMMWGWRHPVLLLPAGAGEWPPERRSLVLLHEAAHARRGDWVIQLLGHVVRALHWFNPVVWLALRHLRREREQACDDLVLRSGFRASEYAGHLLGIARSLPRPLLAQAGAVAMAHPAGMEGRIRRILDPRRVRHGVSRRGALAAASIAAALLVAVAAVQASDTGAPDASGHRPGLRNQWQPQTEHDPRLQQPVHLEIIGRAAVPALQLLSEKTGVALGVVPEDVDTVGERKLTIIAQGCTLKALMVQIPNALQECHWDVEGQGQEPAYLLHRNAGAEATMAELAEQADRREREERRPAREARVAEARAALAMSPQEVDALMKTDPLLAAAAKDPEYRERMETFFSLPKAKLDEFLSTGVAGMELASAPPRLQAWAARSLREKLRQAEERLRERPDLTYDSTGFFSALLRRSGGIGLTYDDVCLPHGFSPIELCISPAHPFDRDAMDHSDTEIIPPQTVDPTFASMYRDLLVRTGVAPAAAEAVLTDLGKQYEAEAIARRDRKREAEWREPRRPELRKVVTLPFTGAVDPTEVQRFIAKESGLSLVSDYFTAWGPQRIPEEARAPQPIWRLLYLLSQGSSSDYELSWMRSDEWTEAGDCLVLHDRGWYYRVCRELPESLLAAYREKLKQQGQFTLEDVAAAAAEWERRKPADPRLRARAYLRPPQDLARAGLRLEDTDVSLLLLYATLSPAQREKARSAAGLAYAEMTGAQRDFVRHSATRWDTLLVPDAEIGQAVYRVAQSDYTCDLSVVFPSRKIGLSLDLPGPKPAATQ